MGPGDIDVARAEAERFLDRCDAAKAALVIRKCDDGIRHFHTNEDTKATAALRRASMDLTRALADLRRRA